MAEWSLPQSVKLGGEYWAVHTDYRDILDILARLADESEPQAERIYVALALFYTAFERMDAGLHTEAWAALCRFLYCGGSEPAHAGAKLLDWEQDYQLIAAEVNRVAGCEVRAAPYLHWYTFMGYFFAIGEGPLATLVAIRAKRAKGKKLEPWEQEYYRENRSRVEFAKQYTGAEQAQKQALLTRLKGGGTDSGK